LADALASGASDRKVVGVQVPPRPRLDGFRPTKQWFKGILHFP
jgi:hypothetical protein